MNSLERVRTVIAGGIPDRVPVSLHNFLTMGQFVGCSDVGRLMQDPELMTEAQIKCWREIGHDVLQLENGVAALAQAVGAEVRYSPTEPPHVAEPILKGLGDARDLKLPDPETTWPLSGNLKATRAVAKEIGDKAFICGRADQGPLALAAALRGVEALVFDLVEATCDPEKEAEVVAFIEFCTECCTTYALAQGAAGAHGTCIGGYGVSVISPDLYRRFEQPYERQYVERVKAAGTVPFIHICGDEIVILPDMIATGAPVFELDPLTDLAAAKQLASGKTTLLGFVDSANVIRSGPVSLIKEHCKAALEIMKPGGGFILSPGCALPIETPAENQKALVEAAEEYGRY